jgi:hypothetical protein
MYADFDVDNLLVIVKRHHLELVQQADRERLCRSLKPPVRWRHRWAVQTLVDGLGRVGFWLRLCGRELRRRRHIPINEGLRGSSRTNKGVQACRAVK